jgi:hypothetical protein
MKMSENHPKIAYDMLNDQHTTTQTFLNDVNNVIFPLKRKDDDLVFLRQLKTSSLSLDKLWESSHNWESSHKN